MVFPTIGELSITAQVKHGCACNVSLDLTNSRTIGQRWLASKRGLRNFLCLRVAYRPDIAGQAISNIPEPSADLGCAGRVLKLTKSVMQCMVVKFRGVPHDYSTENHHDPTEMIDRSLC